MGSVGRSRTVIKYCVGLFELKVDRFADQQTWEKCI
jgi:hypothetical protein